MASIAAHGIRIFVPLPSLIETRSTVLPATTTGKKLDCDGVDGAFLDWGASDGAT